MMEEPMEFECPKCGERIQIVRRRGEYYYRHHVTCPKCRCIVTVIVNIYTEDHDAMGPSEHK